MSFVSYAQNFEDVMLWRALKHVKNGFYIDIGAQHPVVDSVSLAFYEHGWRGVHVEPTLQYSSLLRAARPDESVFQLAIGNQSQQLTFFEFEDTGLSTADAEVARKHQERGFKCRETLVPILSLDALLQQVDARDIHWLKVDVEGLEKEVLESWQSSSKLPWVVVVESTCPMSQEKSHQEWEALLLAKGYSYVYFDGLNRFYVSPEHSELTEAFDTPPNVFDGFVLSGTASQPFYSLVSSRARQAEVRAEEAEARSKQAEVRAEEAEARSKQAEVRAEEAEARSKQAEVRAEEAEARSKQAEVRAEEAETKAQHAESNVHALLYSTSWRVTGPLRLASQLSHRLLSAVRERRVIGGLKRRLHPVIFRSGHWVMHNPRLKKSALSLLNRMPQLKVRLRRIILGPSPVSTADWSASTQSAGSPMSPRTARLYMELKNAIDSRQN
ncbi:FkbM family methyltransferase [Stutzerimonas balearica DSM 6083]|uniref:FkbM family methyltransferase n=1 Tax=Stutzerimonas balearica DSM 6083 TaxID=1123016 RepID=A0A8D3Y1F5_9GAMM|nr:FkbM family methyltransferase [Stutzerimonas balearica]AJE15483.1 FkbM family methyltransferase [Stutzerimonas balearica DSM 6083]